ncbi:hypothetical protein [Catenulispora pinisilvae]|uniref:hypothetical protein n=1 Tax=Catenulispora pinisilvae TaxID=2705253 RepID=UPI001890DD18|nr:hypothetical protein [Catenulispora pinisilvae]
MLAAVLHHRYRLPAAQISRLLDLNQVSIKKHVDNLAELFAEHGYPLAFAGIGVKKLEDLLDLAPLPQSDQRHAEL